MDELANLDALGQATLVRSGAASPAELVEAAIERIERINPQLNAVIGERYEQARAEAAGPLPEGPFRGVPFLVKDLTLTMQGEPYYQGTRVLRALDHRAPADSALARRFRAAGVVVVGRTNTPEFGNTITTEPMSFGPTRNPWELDHSVGGSSGGSAAAVAAGLVPIAHANDGGGSIRIPAAACGLVGLKPSRGRVSLAPAGDPWMGATVEGIVSRSVRDTAAMLDAVAGYEPGDPAPAPPLSRPLAEALGTSPGRLRIGLLDRPPAAELPKDAECAAAVAAASALLERLGHHVEPAWPAALGEEEAASRFTQVVAAATALDVAEVERIVGRPLGEDDLEPDDLTLTAWGRSMSAPDYLAAQAWLRSWCRRVVSWWDCHGVPGASPGQRGAGETGGYDLLLTPTMAVPPPPLGFLSGPEGGSRIRQVLQYTSQFNLTGQPAISLPLHWSAAGLPIGVQLVAAPYREDVLVQVAAQLEAAAPWSHRRPPVHAAK